MKSQLLFIVLVSCAVLFSCSEGKKENQSVITARDSILKSTPADKKAPSFEETVYSVLKALEKKDQAALDALTSPKEGFVVVYRSGVFNEYKHLDKVDFSKPVPETFPYPSFVSNEKLKYADLPKFNCGSMEWNKYGLYCDTIHRDTLLSGVPKNLREYRGDKIPDSEVEKLQQLEKNSRRVVLASAKGNDLIFYLTLIGNKWYLTAIDRITTDCSA